MKAGPEPASALVNALAQSQGLLWKTASHYMFFVSIFSFPKNHSLGSIPFPPCLQKINHDFIILAVLFENLEMHLF